MENRLFFFSLPNGKAETIWAPTHVKLTLPVGLTYLSPASCSSGQWGHGASVITRSSAQEQPHAIQGHGGGLGMSPSSALGSEAKGPVDFHSIQLWCWVYLCCRTPHPALNCITTNATFTVALSRWLGPVLSHSRTGTCLHHICKALGKPPPCSLDFPLSKRQSNAEAIANKTLAHTTQIFE